MIFKKQNLFLSTARELEVRSSAIEKCVIDIVNKFVTCIDEPDYQANKFNWMDAEKALLPVASASALLMGDDAGTLTEIKQNTFYFNALNQQIAPLITYTNRLRSVRI